PALRPNRGPQRGSRQLRPDPLVSGSARESPSSGAGRGGAESGHERSAPGAVLSLSGGPERRRGDRSGAESAAGRRRLHPARRLDPKKSLLPALPLPAIAAASGSRREHGGGHPAPQRRPARLHPEGRPGGPRPPVAGSLRQRGSDPPPVRGAGDPVLPGRL